MCWTPFFCISSSHSVVKRNYFSFEYKIKQVPGAKSETTYRYPNYNLGKISVWSSRLFFLPTIGTSLIFYKLAQLLPSSTFSRSTYTFLTLINPQESCPSARLRTKTELICRDHTLFHNNRKENALTKKWCTYIVVCTVEKWKIF